MPRINNRSELLLYADEYKTLRHPDGRIDKIVVFKRKIPIHTTQVYYTSAKKLDRIEGFLLQEVLSDLETIENIVLKTETTEGETILFDDMEDLLKWVKVAGTSVAYDNAFAFSKDQSLKFACGVGDTQVVGKRFVALKGTGRDSLELVFAVDDFSKLNSLQFWLYHLDEGRQTSAMLQYNVSSQWLLFPSTTPIKTQPNNLETKDNVAGCWHRIKFIINIQTGQYEEVIINGETFETSLANYLSVSTGEAQSYVNIVADNVAGQAVNLWVDDVIVKKESN